ncbi:MAG: hypothetical protein M3N08_07425 [Pseudomonadota bacterium]|nr:hypothetical protein [Pseudomonadota bacterium]
MKDKKNPGTLRKITAELASDAAATTVGGLLVETGPGAIVGAAVTRHLVKKAILGGPDGA